MGHTEATAHMATEATEVPTAGTVTATHMVRVHTPDMDMDTHTAVPTLDFTAVPTLDFTEVRTLDTVASMVLDMDMVATDGMGMDTHTRHLCQQTRLHLEKSESMNIIFTVCYLYDCDSEVQK